jgi:catechol 2,3-dioxygenase-like lactoylglutathione lyase family enzyme
VDGPSGAAGVRGLVHHVEVYVGDIERSLDVWGPLLTELGYDCEAEWDEGTRWRRGPTALSFVQAPAAEDGFDRRRVGLNHVAFHAGSRSEVDALTVRLTAAGARLLYPDRDPYAGGEDHYAAFLEDPDGIKLELVASGG